jgi:hypothetical protein
MAPGGLATTHIAEVLDVDVLTLAMNVMGQMPQNSQKKWRYHCTSKDER